MCWCHTPIDCRHKFGRDPVLDQIIKFQTYLSQEQDARCFIVKFNSEGAGMNLGSGSLCVGKVPDSVDLMMNAKASKRRQVVALRLEWVHKAELWLLQSKHLLNWLACWRHNIDELRQIDLISSQHRNFSRQCASCHLLTLQFGGLSYQCDSREDILTGKCVCACDLRMVGTELRYLA